MGAAGLWYTTVGGGKALTLLSPPSGLPGWSAWRTGGPYRDVSLRTTGSQRAETSRHPAVHTDLMTGTVRHECE
jgi:hypothetical protein